MHGAIGIETANKAKVVDALRDMREERGDIAAALSVLLERPRTSQQRCVALSELADDCPVAGRQWLSIVFFERGLGIERIDLTRPADHEEEDDGFGFSGKVRRLGGQ